MGISVFCRKLHCLAPLAAVGKIVFGKIISADIPGKLVKLESFLITIILTCHKTEVELPAVGGGKVV